MQAGESRAYSSDTSVHANDLNLNRCLQHGGARGAHAPAGNRNNWRDGFYSREMKAERRRINGLIRECLWTLREIDGR